MERWVAKVIAIIVTFLVPFIATLVPYPMSGWIRSKGKFGEQIINRLMCYGGGIFFGTFLLHIGPEVSHKKWTLK
jgi:solute carrier family 39 (zinc transporter), member 1/2/3